MKPQTLRLEAAESPWREAWRLSLPATLSLLLHAGYRVNDQYWIGPLGPAAQAALGVTSFLLILNFAFIALVQSGTLARIALHTGARDAEARQRCFQTSLRLSFACTVVVALVGWATTPFWVRLLGAEGEVAELAQAYLKPIYLTLPLIAVKPWTDGVFLGIGNTMVPMLLAGLAVGLNFVLNPLLIFGWGPAPEMGIAGAAWATGISRGIAGGLGLWILNRGAGLRWRGLPFDRHEMARILRIGTPVALTHAAYALVFVGVLKTSVARFGESVQAGLGVAFNGIESISYCGLMGPAIACSSIVGRRLGAQDHAGARTAVGACLTLSLSIALLASLLFGLLPERLVSFYSDDPTVLREAALYLAVVAWSQTATSADSVLQQALAGAGRTTVMSLTTTLGLSLRIPLAFFLAHSMAWGPHGIWWAFNLTNWLKLVAIVLVFRAARITTPPTPPSWRPSNP